jgi:hypothetical protein
LSPTSNHRGTGRRAESVGGLGTASRGRSDGRAPPRAAARTPRTRRTTGELEVVGRALHGLPRGRAWRGRGVDGAAMLQGRSYIDSYVFPGIANISPKQICISQECIYV